MALLAVAMPPRRLPAASTPTRRSARSSADRLQRGVTVPPIVLLAAEAAAGWGWGWLPLRFGLRRLRRRWLRSGAVWCCRGFHRGRGGGGTGSRRATGGGRAVLGSRARPAERFGLDRDHDRRFGVIVGVQRRDPPQRRCDPDMQADRQGERRWRHAPGLRHPVGQRSTGQRPRRAKEGCCRGSRHYLFYDPCGSGASRNGSPCAVGLALLVVAEADRQHECTAGAGNFTGQRRIGRRFRIVSITPASSEASPLDFSMTTFIKRPSRAMVTRVSTVPSSRIVLVFLGDIRELRDAAHDRPEIPLLRDACCRSCRPDCGRSAPVRRLPGGPPARAVAAPG